ncbi:MAG: hypothetical protein ACO1PI_05455 [Bacteroidota bacterium]
MELFKTAPLVKRSLFQRILKQHPVENAVIEANNLLATKPIAEITTQMINDIEDKYQISMRSEFSLNLKEFYAVYLNHCLTDKVLSDEEIGNLAHLKVLFSLSDSITTDVHQKIGKTLYETSFKEAVSDGRLTEKEKAFLSKIETQLQLPELLVKKIAEGVLQNYMNSKVAQIIADERISPEEEKELEQLAKNLDVAVTMDTDTRRKYERLKLYWALENLSLPEISSDVKLQKSEKCYFQSANVSWYELRSVRGRTSYSGYSSRIKVAKGFYLNMGTYSSHTPTSQEYKLIDKGTLYLTNKRIIFTGGLKNSNIRLDKILYIQPSTDGVEINKDAGRNPILTFKGDMDVFCIITERLLNEK